MGMGDTITDICRWLIDPNLFRERRELNVKASEFYSEAFCILTFILWLQKDFSCAFAAFQQSVSLSAVF